MHVSDDSPVLVPNCMSRLILPLWFRIVWMSLLIRPRWFRIVWIVFGEHWFGEREFPMSACSVNAVFAGFAVLGVVNPCSAVFTCSRVRQYGFQLCSRVH